MNKYIKTVTSVTLLTAMLFSLTCCGKKTEDVSTEAPVSQEIQTTTYVPLQEVVTESAEIVTPVNNTTAAQQTTTAAPAVSQSPATTSSSPETTVKENTTSAPKKEPTTATTPATTAAEIITEAETKKDLSNLSVKSIQDMLFSTTDPTIAGKILTVAGFEYDEEQGVYYGSMDSFQRLFGFNVIYDTVAPRVGMIYETERIYFTYDDKDWMVQLWKGQYGITAGGEIGLYNKPCDRTVPQYDCAKDYELISMKFDFYNGGNYEFTRGPEKHWWLTGFKVFQIGIAPLITMDITLEFPNRKMANEFEKGLKKVSITSLIDKVSYTRTGNTFNIVW